jgi:hypothetical protein
VRGRKRARVSERKSNREQERARVSEWASERERNCKMEGSKAGCETRMSMEQTQCALDTAALEVTSNALHIWIDCAREGMRSLGFAIAGFVTDVQPISPPVALWSCDRATPETRDYNR